MAEALADGAWSSCRVRMTGGRASRGVERRLRGNPLVTCGRSCANERGSDLHPASFAHVRIMRGQVGLGGGGRKDSLDPTFFGITASAQAIMGGNIKTCNGGWAIIWGYIQCNVLILLGKHSVVPVETEYNENKA